MKTKFRILGALMAMVIVAIFYFSCRKESSANLPAGMQHVSIYLTDGPSLFDHVWVDIRSVSVWVDTCAAIHHDEGDDDGDHEGDHEGDDDERDSCLVWDSLSIRPGVYDLLTLTNGTDTLLASGMIPAGKIKKLRIVLGNNNSLVKDSVTYPLHLFPGDSTITIKLRGDEFDEYLTGHLQVWLDFDVARSIIVFNNNQFYLRPFIRLFILSNTGSIEGSVMPWQAFSVISIYNSSDTAYAIPRGDEGEFKVRGLSPGTYSLFINASNGYQDTTITNVTVTAHQETDVGRITLHQ